MRYSIDAACGCHKGRVRSNNEDNFFFGGRCLEVENNGLRHPVTLKTEDGEMLTAVFDGMGGERCGEYAAFAAAKGMCGAAERLNSYYIPGKEFLTQLVETLNKEVLSQANVLGASRMGCTAAILFFSSEYAYACNVGDSRIYRLRQGTFQQLSVDHVDRQGSSGGKAPLTQCLGIDPEEFLIEPYIAKGKLQQGDRFLLCSDGLTDMLSNIEISDILSVHNDPAECVRALIDSALTKGGKDNVTAIVCFIAEI